MGTLADGKQRPESRGGPQRRGPPEVRPRTGPLWLAALLSGAAIAPGPLAAREPPGAPAQFQVEQAQSWLRLNEDQIQYRQRQGPEPAARQEDLPRRFEQEASQRSHLLQRQQQERGVLQFQSRQTPGSGLPAFQLQEQRFQREQAQQQLQFNILRERGAPFR